MPDQGQWILVLEDDPVQSMIYEKILRVGGYQVTCIPDPVDFVSSLESLPIPAAILLDIILPGMDGIAVMLQLERDARWCAVPVIIMTASPTRDRVTSAQKLPVPPEGFLVKPVDPQGMLQTLKSVLFCKEPLILLRSLQRKRLSLKTTLSETLVEIEMSLRSADEAFNDCAGKMAEARRELQSLHLMHAQVRDTSPETQRQVKSRARELEELIESLRQRVNQTVVDRRNTLQRRHDVMTKQKTIRELERQIQSMALVLRQQKSPRPGAAPNAQASGSAEALHSVDAFDRPNPEDDLDATGTDYRL